jgi:xanthine dehydrogenase accessory factor
MTLRILARGGGDLASGAIIRLHRAGWSVLVTELAQPRTVRRGAAFAQAVYDGETVLEGVRARLVDGLPGVLAAQAAGAIPVLIDPGVSILSAYEPDVVLDGRMLKRSPELSLDAAALIIGLGPGFSAGQDCHVVIETNRGPDLGRVIWEGQAQADTGIPERVGEYRSERVLRAPVQGQLRALAVIGAMLTLGDDVAQVDGERVRAPFAGVLRGIMMDGLTVQQGEKIGDLDPRGDPELCWKISDKALAIGGGVLEAVLSWKSGRSGKNGALSPEGR